MTKFSIIIPCFNVEATILQTLASLTSQCFTNWEAICVDDGSTDATCPLIQAAARHDSRIGLICNSGKGPSSARNLGALHYADGDVIAFCDADDLWLPTKLCELADTFADHSIDGAFGQIGFFKNSPSDSSVFSTVPQDDLSIEMLLGENPVCTMSNISVRLSAFVRTDGFDPEIVHNEDLEWLVRLVGDGAKVVGLPSLQTWYRTSIGGLSTDLAAMEAGRTFALKSAARFGVQPCGKSHAIHHRYLARRALRLGASRTEALRHAVTGIAHSPVGFLTPFNRGALTFVGALSATVLPRAVRQSLFS